MVSRSHLSSSGIQTTLRCLHDMYPEHKLYGLFCLKGDKDLKSIAVQLKGKFKKLFVAGSDHRLINNPKQLSIFGFSFYLDGFIKNSKSHLANMGWL